MVFPAANDETRIRQSLQALSFQNSLFNIGVNVLAAAGITGVLWDLQTLHKFLLFWFGAVVALSLFRIYSLYRHAVSKRELTVLSPPKAGSWQYWNSFGLLTGCAMWVILTINVFDFAAPTDRLAILIVISALAAGATGILAPLRITGKLYIAGMLGHGSLALMFLSAPSYELAALGFAFLLVMLVTHQNNHTTLKKSLQLQFTNEALVDDLNAQKTGLQTLNADLERRVQKRTEQLRLLAEKDALTSLLNRVGMADWLDNRCKSAAANEQLGIIFIDLDRFKQINDGLGHAIGDQILECVSDRLAENTPPGAAVCRWGGDEFVMLVPAQKKNVLETVRELTDKLRSKIEQPYQVGHHSLHLGFSAGISIAEMSLSSANDAIRDADLAMSDVKRNGRGSVRIYSDDLSAVQERRHSIEQALRQQMAKEEFSIVFQPIVSAQTNEIDSHEVLLRWHSSLLGPVSPGEFIPIAEDTGNIKGIGNFVFSESVRRLAEMIQRGFSGRLSINVSVCELENRDWLEFARKCLAEHGIGPEYFIIELTETAFHSGNIEDLRAVLQEIHAFGFDIHIDDFGTGYASLERLHKMPVSALKIDKSFVQKMDEGTLAIIEGSIVIARKSGISVIAEGVETAEQADLLRTLGADYLQGYYFSRPLPELQFAASEVHQMARADTCCPELTK